MRCLFVAQCSLPWIWVLLRSRKAQQLFICFFFFEEILRKYAKCRTLYAFPLLCRKHYYLAVHIMFRLWFTRRPTETRIEWWKKEFCVQFRITKTKSVTLIHLNIEHLCPVRCANRHNPWLYLKHIRKHDGVQPLKKKKPFFHDKCSMTMDNKIEMKIMMEKRVRWFEFKYDDCHCHGPWSMVMSSIQLI